MTPTRPPWSWLREPMLHMLLVGGALLLLHRALAPRRERVTLGEEERAALRADHRRRGGAPPSAAEERQLAERYVESEILYREALARGLDRGDMIVRRRLIQKMEFLLEAEAEPEPDEAALRAQLDASPARYALGERRALDHVFVSGERGGAAQDLAAALRARLVSGAEPQGLGDPFPRGALPLQTRPELAATLGEDAAAAAFALPEGAWSAPLRSPYGLHLLRLRALRPPRPAALDEVREQLRADLRAARRAQARREALDRLRSRYDVRIAP